MSSSIYRTQLKDKFYSICYGKKDQPKIHFGLGKVKGICGAKTKKVTLNIDDVNCKSCMHHIKKRKK